MSSLNHDQLVRGAILAMEQGWHLLSDAVLLFRAGRYASSLALSTFAIEELGKAEIYRVNAKRALSGQEVTAGSMGRHLSQHTEKLKRARIPVTVGLGASYSPESFDPFDGSGELAKRLAAARKIRETQAPKRFLRDRKRALYVDRVAQFPGWTRPSTSVDRDAADEYLGCACIRYSEMFADWASEQSEVGVAVQQLMRNIELPTANWDVMTWEDSAPEPRKAQIS